MDSIPRLGALFAAALAASSISWSEPALATCTVAGIPYPVMKDQPDDPTGPALYIKKAPEDDVTYFVRVRDSRTLDPIRKRLGQVRILVKGDAPNCPTDGSFRDLGSAVGGVTLLQASVWIDAEGRVGP